MKQTKIILLLLISTLVFISACSKNEQEEKFSKYLKEIHHVNIEEKDMTYAIVSFTSCYGCATHYLVDVNNYLKSKNNATLILVTRSDTKPEEAKSLDPKINILLDGRDMLNNSALSDLEDKYIEVKDGKIVSVKEIVI